MLWSTIRASRILLAGSGLLSLAALLIVVWQMPNIFDLSGHQLHEARWSLFLASIGISTSIALSTPSMVIVGHGRSDLLSKRAVAVGLLTSAGECAVALSGGNVIGVCAVMACGSALTSLVNVVLMRAVVAPKPTGPGADRAEVRDVLGEGMANFVISIAGTVAFTSDTIVLGAVAPLSAIAAYTIAAKLPALIRMVTSRAIDLLQPTYSHLDARKAERPGAAFAVLSRATRLSTALALAAGIGAASSSGWLLHLWIGHVPKKAELTLILLLAGAVLQMFGHAVYVYLTGVRRLRRLVVFSVASASLNVVLSVILGIHLGAPGPAVASLICVAVGDLFVLPLISASALDVRPAEIVNELLARPLLPLIPAVALVLGVHVSPDSAWSLLVGTTACLIYCVGFALLLTPADRQLARDVWRRRRSGGAASA